MGMIDTGVIGRTVSSILAICLSTAAMAEPCTDMGSGAYPATQSLQTLVDMSKKAGLKKDEFETTAAYQARLSAAGAGLDGKTYVIEWPLDSGFKFDADTGMVSYSNYTLNTTCLISSYGLSDEVKAVKFGPKAKYGVESSYCFDRTTSQESGTPYKASNSYGASVEVKPIRAKGVGIYLGSGDISQNVWTGKSRDYSSSDLFKVSMEPEAARSLKENGTALFVISPKAPFAFQSSYHIEPKINRPTEITTTTDYIVADVACVALADPKLKKVYQVRELRAGR
jgi:hypothetical protein